MTTLHWHGRSYTVERDRGFIYVSRDGGTPAKASNEAEAVKWLTCMSLRKGQARRLVDDELNGNYGAFSGR